MLTLDQLYLLIPPIVAALIASIGQFGYYTPDQAALGVRQRLSSTMLGLMLTIIFSVIMSLSWEWKWYWVTFWSFILGLTLETGVRKFIEFMRSAKDFEDYGRRGKKAYDIIKGKDTTSSDQTTPPANDTTSSDQTTPPINPLQP